MYAVVPGDSVELDAGPGLNYSWEPAIGLSCSDCRYPIYSGQTEASFAVTVENEAGCITTNTIEVVLDLSGAYDIPNAFSPNNDGTNDVFRVLAAEGTFTEFRLRIFSRWGQLVYETDDAVSGWDGYFEDQQMPADIYVYELVFRLTSGPEIIDRGELTLLR